jgi:hypothetical protein
VCMLRRVAMINTMAIYFKQVKTGQLDINKSVT